VMSKHVDALRHHQLVVDDGIGLMAASRRLHLRWSHRAEYKPMRLPVVAHCGVKGTYARVNHRAVGVEYGPCCFGPCVGSLPVSISSPCRHGPPTSGRDHFIDQHHHGAVAAR
jgi:hypothetical protein